MPILILMDEPFSSVDEQTRRKGAIRGVKGVVIGQLLIAILGVGELFELYSQYFLMEEFWALVIIVFMFAFAVSEAVAFLERRVDYYASTR
jgi:NitT/TauT family transport system permease protein